METLYYAQSLLIGGGIVLFMVGGFAAAFGYAGDSKESQKVGFGMAVVGLVLLILALVAETQHPQMYEYTIKAYYLGGCERIMTVKSDKYGPQIDSYRGSYTLDTRFDGVYEQGVVRFEVISKRPITEQ